MKKDYKVAVAGTGARDIILYLHPLYPQQQSYNFPPFSPPTLLKSIR